MCRSISEGGRRCPGRSNPDRVVQYNEIRRDHYHTNKDDNLSGATQAPEYFSSNPLITSESFNEIADSIHANEALNITSIENTGTLVEQGYLAKKTIRGKIDYTNLDEESYKEFGFSEIESDDDFSEDTKFIPYEKTYTIEEDFAASEQEMKNLTELESASVKYFTTDNHSWIGWGLYDDVYDSENYEDDEEDGEYAPRSANIEELILDPQQGATNSEDVELAPTAHQTKDNLRKILVVTDNALAKAPKKQRIVYRGATELSQEFEQFGGVENWIAENVSLGEELKFDGYQSATNNLDSAIEFSGGNEGGAIFEILTPEGLNIQSKSYFPEEREIMLPRQSRYIVVGIHENTNVNSYNKTVIQMVAINENGDILDGTNASAPKNI